MVPRSPLSIALLSALSTSAVMGAALYWGPWGNGARLAAEAIGIYMLIAFVVAFTVTFLLVRGFVQQRVDLIHRTMHEARGGRSARAPLGGEDLGEVDAEVSAWAVDKRAELSGLRERERYRREFIGNLAHELRTPIFNIQGYILTLLEGGLEDPKVNREFLERAGKGADRMVRIVEDLGMVSQLESGVLDMRLERTDLNGPVDQSIRDMRKRAAARNFTFRNEIGDDTFALADADRLEQVLGNLFTNALHYGREGGHCTVRAFDIGEQVLVEVADDGPGIAAEHLPRLFERFYRVGSSRARSEGGTGLGLAIVKHIVESHRGTITAASELGRGTTFSFTLPAAP